MTLPPPTPPEPQYGWTTSNAPEADPGITLAWTRLARRLMDEDATRTSMLLIAACYAMAKSSYPTVCEHRRQHGVFVPEEIWSRFLSATGLDRLAPKPATEPTA